jgi:hypothetical protein
MFVTTAGAASVSAVAAVAVSAVPAALSEQAAAAAITATERIDFTVKDSFFIRGYSVVKRLRLSWLLQVRIIAAKISVFTQCCTDFHNH